MKNILLKTSLQSIYLSITTCLSILNNKALRSYIQMFKEPMDTQGITQAKKSNFFFLKPFFFKAQILLILRVMLGT